LISIITPSRRVPVAQLINPAFDTRLSAAQSALARVVEEEIAESIVVTALRRR
jgi:hypothetical protein